MNAYSIDLRKKVVAAVERGMPQPAVAATFGVSSATITRWVRQARTGAGALAPRSIPGRPAKLGAALDAGLAGQLQALPDATLAEHCAVWAETTGQTVSLNTMRRAILRTGWTRKKRV
jgi:transposase